MNCKITFNNNKSKITFERNAPTNNKFIFHEINHTRHLCFNNMKLSKAIFKARLLVGVGTNKRKTKLDKCVCEQNGNVFKFQRGDIAAVFYGSSI